MPCYKTFFDAPPPRTSRRAGPDRSSPRCVISVITLYKRRAVYTYEVLSVEIIKLQTRARTKPTIYYRYFIHLGTCLTVQRCSSLA